VLSYATFNSLAHNLVFLALPGSHALNLLAMGWMFVGDIAGAVAFFLVANMITSIWIHRPLKRRA
jgi:hypothetical protein